jgi:apolipoprotein D and lipocalin family protein
VNIGLRVGLVLLLSSLIAGCTGLPDGVKPVDDFDLGRYLGKWYELARLDHSFERGMQRVSAEYSLRADGGVQVVNRGFSVPNQKWEEANGKAYFVGASDEGYLKVSFFGPFYGSYVVFELDEADYQYAFVAGPDKNYLWLLSRTPTLSVELRERFTRTAAALGFDTDKLIFVEQP